MGLQFSGDTKQSSAKVLFAVSEPFHVFVHWVSTRVRHHLIRSSAKGGGSDLARVALRVYFVSLGSIQH
jgi:hypothetical protein